MAQPWYQSAVIYGLDVRSFADSNGDGVGDFTGLAQRLEHLAALGVSCLRLQPVFPSPPGDDGQNVIDHYGVDPALGTLGDFVELLRQARERGMHVLLDLVLAHTAVDHSWFQAARQDRDSPYRGWYLWSDEPPPDAPQSLDPDGARRGRWSWDETAQSFYFHRLHAGQAELDLTHPGVRREIEKIAGFWLQLGVSGFHVDARPLLWPPRGGSRAQRSGLEVLHELRRHVSTLRGDACLLAEAGVPPREWPHGLGEGEPAQLYWNAWLNQHLMLALARGDARPLRQAWDALPPLPAGCGWANFLRDQDGVGLGLLGEQERQEVFAAFGAEPEMQIDGQGLRRRLAPMLGNDARRLALAHSLLLTLPGTPVLCWGDEIGMGEDLSLVERSSVRTPMQWSDAPAGGFSGAPADRLFLPVVSGGEFGFESVNVEAQCTDPLSMLNRLERMLRLRRATPALGQGCCEFLDLGAPALLAMRCEHAGSVLYTLHNLGAVPVELALPPCEAGCGLHDRLEGRPLATHDDGSCWLALEPYGYRWLRRG